MPELYSTTNLIINNIPSEISDEHLNKLFRSFGAIKSYKIIRGHDRESKAFGFCEYNDSKSAKQALLKLDNYPLNNLLLKVSYAKLFPKPKGKCIEVVNLPKSTQEEIVRKYFSQFGRIARLRLLLNNDNGTRNTDANMTRIAEIVFENKADAEKACVQNSVKWNYENGKQVLVTVSLIGSEKSRQIDRDSLSVDSNRSLINSNILYINSNPKQLGDQNNYFFQFNNNVNGGQGQVEQTFNTNSLFDFSNLSNIVNCTSFMPFYHHHGNPTATPTAFQFANNLQAAAEFYSAQHFNNVAIQIPQNPHSQFVTGNHYEINDKSGPMANSVIVGSPSPTIPVQYHQGQNPFAAIYPNYNSLIQTSNPLPMSIPLIYTTLTNNYPIKTGAYDNNSLINQIKSDYLYPKNNCNTVINNNTNNNGISHNGSVASGVIINNKSLSKSSYVLYVYNIGNSTTKEQLKELFGPKFGKEIIKVDVPKDSQNGSNKNFGFVTFGNYQKAQLAIQEMNGKEFQGKPLQVSFKK